MIAPAVIMSKGVRLTLPELTHAFCDGHCPGVRNPYKRRQNIDIGGRHLGAYYG